MTTNMVKRNTHTYSVPLSSDVTILRPELVVLKFGDSNTVDIGRLCYMQRTNPTSKFRVPGRKVVLESISPKRVESVRRLVAYISDTAQLNQRQILTLHDAFSRLVAFVNWADENIWPDVLASEATMRPALFAYLQVVRDRVARNELSLNAGAKQQEIVVATLSQYFDVELRRGLNLLRRDKNSGEPTLPPSENAQARVLSLCESLFNGICKLVLDHKSFPFGLAMPSYLSFPNDQLWIFPAKAWFKTPKMVGEKVQHAGYDYAHGRLATAEELKMQYDSRPQLIAHNAAKRLHLANSNQNDPLRWAIAKQAFGAFMILFIADTAMNWSQVVNLTWDDRFEVMPSKQGFRTIKWRAGGREVSFELPISSMPRFKRFLQLRAYILGSTTSPYLFFTKISPHGNTTKILSGLERTYSMLRRIDPSLVALTTREWRAAKSDWLIRNKDVATAALVLQNTERTILKNYANGSDTLYREEMSHFLSSVSSAVLAKNEATPSSTPISVGACISFGEPVAIPTAAHVKPDCVKSEGCLFCEKFKVHADKTDARKLLSCRYVISLTAPLADSEESFIALVAPIISRIDQVVSEMAEREPDMIIEMRRNVDENGELDPYWAGKAEMLMTLGL